MDELKEPRGFKKAWKRAEALLKNDGRVQKLLKKAVSKSAVSEKAMKGYWGDFQTLIRLIRNYVSGDYREVAISTLLFALAGVIYFVNPFDVIPDFILGLGFIDDVSVVAYVLGKIKEEINQFLNWEEQKPLKITSRDED
jgi:uncharacterized membrane protein YkvA (DUF1232 family)